MIKVGVALLLDVASACSVKREIPVAFISLQMRMSYWFGVDLGSFLFPGYDVTTVWGLVATCLGLIALAVLYEAMKVSQIHLQQTVIRSMPRTTSASSESSSLLSRVTPKNFRIYTRWYTVLLSPWSDKLQVYFVQAFRGT